MSRYTGVTDEDLREMLDAIGAGSLEDLFADIPSRCGWGGSWISRGSRSRRSTSTWPRWRPGTGSNEEEISLGAGMYDHYVPALIDTLLSRSEFLTPYTPYQPEISQGGLQVMFEFQTAISELTGLPVSNASVYEGPSAVAAAGYLAKLETKRTAGGEPRAAPALARGAGHPRGRVRHGGRGGAARRRGRHRPRRRSRPRWTTTRRCSCSSRTSSARWRTSARCRRPASAPAR